MVIYDDENLSLHHCILDKPKTHQHGQWETMVTIFKEKHCVLTMVIYDDKNLSLHTVYQTNLK